MTSTEARDQLYRHADAIRGYPLEGTDLVARLSRAARRLTERADEGADVLLTAQGLEPIMAKLEAVVRELEDAA